MGYSGHTKPIYDMAFLDCHVISRGMFRLADEFNKSVVGVGIPHGVYKALLKEIGLKEAIADPNTTKIKFAESMYGLLPSTRVILTISSRSSSLAVPSQQVLTLTRYSNVPGLPASPSHPSSILP